MQPDARRFLGFLFPDLTQGLARAIVPSLIVAVCVVALVARGNRARKLFIHLALVASAASGFIMRDAARQAGKNWNGSPRQGIPSLSDLVPQGRKSAGNP
jgi:hypothetical protein